jgi:tetratricopeptide (TPR) repeat protein
MADIIIVGDGPANRAVALEMAGHTSAVREMERDAIWSANSFASRTLGPDDRRGMPSDDLEETGSRLGRYASYTELIARCESKIDVPRAIEILRDPHPREKCGYIYPAARPRTICRPVTSFSLVMQPKAQRMWVGDPLIPAPLGRYLGFDLRTESPVAESPVPPTGFYQATQAYEHFSAGRYTEALLALEEALGLDGESVPLRLMMAQVYRALGQADAARAQAENARAHGAVAGMRLPFPSAIKPLTYLTMREAAECER